MACLPVLNFNAAWSIINKMRRWFAILMLLLLPIRGLVGDAMAYSMLPMPLQTPQPVATQVMQIVQMKQAAAERKMPCHEANDASQEGNPADAPQCTTCQVCHLTMSYPMQSANALQLTAAAPPVQHASTWHSAELRLSVKPPVL
jgi:hypothetical protein